MFNRAGKVFWVLSEENVNTKPSPVNQPSEIWKLCYRITRCAIDHKQHSRKRILEIPIFVYPNVQSSYIFQWWKFYNSNCQIIHIDSKPNFLWYLTYHLPLKKVNIIFHSTQLHAPIPIFKVRKLFLSFFFLNKYLFWAGEGGNTHIFFVFCVFFQHGISQSHKFIASVNLC